MFVETDVGFINLAFVSRIDRGPNGRALIHFDNSSRISTAQFEDVVDQLGEIVQENHGIQALFFDVDRDEVVHWLEPVVAWRVTNDGATPITPGSGSSAEYLLYPSGKVEHLFVGAYDSLDAAIEAFKSAQA